MLFDLDLYVSTHRIANDKDKRVTTPGDVTQHGIEQSLERAIKNAKLDRFESFLGENWSSERLRTKVLDRVLAELDSLFKGNSRGYAPMQELDSLIDRAAQSTYRRVFEVSELWLRTAVRPSSCSASIRSMAV